MHCDEICERQDIFDRIVERNTELASTFTRAIRVVGDDFHAERMSTIGHEPADTAEAEDGERLVIKLSAREIAAIPTAGFHAGIRCCHVTRSCEHERHGMFSS